MREDVGVGVGAYGDERGHGWACAGRSSPYSGKVCCSAGEVQSQGRTLQDFPFFSAPIGLWRSKRAQGPQSASILRLSRGCLVAVAWRRSSRLFRAKSCGNCRENLCSRAAEKGHEYNGPISPRPRAWSTQKRADEAMTARVARGKNYTSFNSCSTKRSPELTSQLPCA